MRAPDGIAALRTFINEQTDPAQKAALTRAVDAFEGMVKDSPLTTTVTGRCARALSDVSTFRAASHFSPFRRCSV